MDQVTSAPRASTPWASVPRVPCSACGGPTGYKRGAVESATCNPCRSAMTNASCALCETPFRSVRRSDGRLTRFCSASCARRQDAINAGRVGRDPVKLKAKDERSRRRRRAQLAGVAHEPYTLAQIAERDGFLCWLCGDRVDMRLKFPHPQSGSIDHVVPISLGGDDMKSNVRLAHFVENCRRGNREAMWDSSTPPPVVTA